MPVYQARAKLNLRLRVLAREASGWHQIESLMCLVDLADDVHIEPGGDGLVLDTGGFDAGPAADNLVVRAAHAFFAATGADHSLRIRLVKRIPAGAGLGGGSSDAATTLHALNALHGRPLESARLFEIGLSLGSDVPFFLARTPMALVWGRGERVLTLPAPAPAHVLIVVPEQRIATATAYARMRERDLSTGSSFAVAVFDDMGQPSWDAIVPLAGNDFEPIADALVPALPAIRHTLRSHGAGLVQLTGSGSAAFALFDDAARLPEAAQAVEAVAPGALVLPTMTTS